MAEFDSNQESHRNSREDWLRQTQERIGQINLDPVLRRVVDLGDSLPELRKDPKFVFWATMATAPVVGYVATKIFERKLRRKLNLPKKR